MPQKLNPNRPRDGERMTSIRIDDLAIRRHAGIGTRSERKSAQNAAIGYHPDWEEESRRLRYLRDWETALYIESCLTGNLTHTITYQPWRGI
jgi:hypothetical protein